MSAPDPYPIAPDIAHLAQPIDTFRPHPKNTRQGDVGAIAVSLRAYGQTIPAVVQRSTGYIVKGSHTWKAGKALRATRHAFSVMDLSDAEAEGYLLMDNRTSDLASYDEAALAQMVREQHEAGRGDATGYDGDALDDLLRDTGQFAVEEKPYHHDQEGFLDRFLHTTIRQLSMHFSSEEYAAVVARLDRALAVAGVPTHTEAFLFLLSYWEVAQGDTLPELEAGDDAEEAAD
jgi:hypothetical protein